MTEFETGNTVFGYFSSETQAEQAMRELREAGFTRDQISLAGRPDTEAYGSGTTTAESTAHREGRKAGEAAGGFWHRMKNFFDGNSPEPYADESTRGEMASHEITNDTDVYDYDPEEFNTSWGAGSGERSRYFSQQYGQTGQGIIVMVNAGDRRAEAERILQSNGADLGDSTTETTADYSGEAAYADRNTPTGDLQSSRRIQLYGEVLRVHRDRVQRGEVRLRKETVTETQNVQVPVTREELVIERQPVTGEQAAPDATVGSETDEIRIPLSEERVRVDKEPVVREEVEVGKRQVTSTENREETVRREELRVDNEEDRLRKAS